MYHIDYSYVKITHHAQQEQITRLLDQQGLARFSSKDSPNLVEKAVHSLGDGLIRWGEKLKDGNDSRPAAMLPTYDCD